jgi:hypothetical protein
MGQTENRDNGTGGNPAGNQPNKHSVFFGHGAGGKKNQRFTIAIVPVDEKTAKVGIAVCGAKDSFVKRIGRLMAEGRANKKPILVYHGVDTTTVEGMLEIKKRAKEELGANIIVTRALIGYGKCLHIENDNRRLV